PVGLSAGGGAAAAYHVDVAAAVDGQGDRVWHERGPRVVPVARAATAGYGVGRLGVAAHLAHAAGARFGDVEHGLVRVLPHGHRLAERDIGARLSVATGAAAHERGDVAAGLAGDHPVVAGVGDEERAVALHEDAGRALQAVEKRRDRAVHGHPADAVVAGVAD